MPRSVLIRRDYRGYTGGHRKFRDYVRHIDAAAGWQATVYLTAESLRDAGNPFLDVPHPVAAWEPAQADALLLGGMDWAAVPWGLQAQTPVVNLVQHLRHADAGSPLHRLLDRRALRICVSHPVADALRATGRVNGPLRVIPAAVDTDWLAQFTGTPQVHEVFIDAVKQPALGQAVADRLQRLGLRIHLQITRLAPQHYLQAIASAMVVLTLPDPTEGFYLPGLEAMAIGRPLVQPDGGGTREYAEDGQNALVPPRTATALAEAVRMLHADASLRQRLVEAGQRTAARFDLSVERQSVHDLLHEMDALWMS